MPPGPPADSSREADFSGAACEAAACEGAASSLVEGMAKSYTKLAMLGRNLGSEKTLGTWEDQPARNPLYNRDAIPVASQRWSQGDISPFHLVHCFLDCRCQHPGNTFSAGGWGIFSSTGIYAKASQEALKDTRKEVAFQGLVCPESHKDLLRDLNVPQGLNLNDFTYPTLVSSHPLSKVSEEAPNSF